MAKVRFTETALRDAHQSLLATRMRTRDMIPIAEEMDKVGYFSVEAWGGATFDTCIRYLNEDPWERLRQLKAEFNHTPIQMLLRGQNLVGYKHYPDDIVTKFVEKSYENGVDVFRIFDALNDIRNMEKAIKVAKDQGAHVQGTISYTISPVHNNESFIKMDKDLENMGADSICIKDMAGLLTPYVAYDLVKDIKSSVKIPIELHTHYTSGVASMTYLKAIEAGGDIVDCALSPMALGTSQPPTEPLVATLAGTEYDTGLSLDKLSEISEYVKTLRDKYIASGLLDTKLLGVDINTLKYQVPGGMLSNLVSQLKQQGKEDKLDDVLREVPEVRKDFGYPPLVTPSSQIVGTQAVLNVLMGERYKMVTKESKAIVKGEYGSTTVPIDPEFIKKIIGDEEPITCRPADLIKPELDKLRSEISEYIEQDEDVLSYALFDQVAVKFFKERQAAKYKLDPNLADTEAKTHPF